MNNRKRKILIALIIIFFIITLILLTLNFKQKKKVSNDSSGVKGNNVNITENLKSAEELGIYNPENDNNIADRIYRIKDNITFYSIENCIKKYESIVNLDYTKDIDENGKQTLASIYEINNEETKKEVIIKLLDKEYINNNMINKNNVLEKIGATTKKIIVEAIQINKLIDSSQNVEGYSVYAKKTLNNKSNYLYYIVKITPNNNFCIYPITINSYSNINDIKVKNTTTEIELNDMNSYTRADINEGIIVSEYIQDYKFLLLNNPSVAYSKLNNNYRNKRFGNIQKFNKYISDNKEAIQLMQVYRYSYKSNTDYNEYKIKDSYGRIYIIYEYYPREYEILLDDYTVEIDEYKQNYEKAEDSTKIAIQIGKFKQMLNTKDYNAIYEKLNSTFKKNNYSTVAKLESYLAKNIYDINTIIIEDYSKNEDYYICKCVLQNQKNTNEQKNMTIVIKLIDSNNFEMSFSFNE